LDDFCLFQKRKFALKVQRFQDIEDIQKKSDDALKTVSSSGTVIELIA
jgi:hypothetical protein